MDERPTITVINENTPYVVPSPSTVSTIDPSINPNHDANPNFTVEDANKSVPHNRKRLLENEHSTPQQEQKNLFDQLLQEQNQLEIVTKEILSNYPIDSPQNLLLKGKIVGFAGDQLLQFLDNLLESSRLQLQK